MALSSFVGRERLLIDLDSTLARARLVTLTGVGGAGKTRLASEFAHGHNDVVFTELAATGRDELVASRVAEALGIKDQSAREVTEVLHDHLVQRKLLLVLDNCEHLRTAVAELATALLDGAPELTILATSREALGIPGEHIVVVPPLEMPPSPDVPMSTGYEAVALLADRAAATVPGWELTDANWPDVVRLLHRVGGLPLGIELATVRLRAMPLAEAARRLDDQIRLLTRNDRVTLPHHRTLRAVIDWSHDLCTPAEQRLWARASVFAGGWDLTAAEAVCGGDVVDELAGLVAKSIVSYSGGRYLLLEPLRQYGAERLKALGEHDTTLLRHRDHYAGMVRYVADNWFTSSTGSAAMIETVRAEMPNIRVALATSLAEPDHAVELTLHLARTMAPYFFGGMPETRRWAATALNLSSGGTPSVVRADATCAAGYIGLIQGLHDEFERRYAECLELERLLGGPQASASFFRGVRLWFLEGDRAALVPLREARDLYLLRGPTWLGQRLVLTVQLAMAAALLGDSAEGHEALREVGEFAEATGVSISAVESAWAEGVLELRFGDLGRAEALLRSALAPQRDAGDQWGAVWSTEALAWVAAAAGPARRAARLLGAASALQRLTGMRLDRLAPFQRMREQAVTRAQCPEYEREYAAGAALRSFEEIIATALRDDVPDVLTPAQLEVAELVAAGLTNREIAAKLHKSQRTVETQVQQIFAALGVNRRVLIARALNLS